MITIGELWKSFEDEVLNTMPGGVGDVQYTETRRAFYAGAQCVLYAIIENGSDEGLDQKKPNENIFMALRTELDKFSDDLRKGLV